MSTQPKALRLADALDAEFVQGRISNSTGRESAVELRRLHEALETEQEPVAWYCNEGLNRGVSLKQESPKWAPLYTAPKQWIGLTDEEIYDCEEEVGMPQYEISSADLYAFASVIEAKLREKNT
jgi:hypothetical protein